MRVCLMVEGQEGVTWEQWLALATACEEGGLEALFRSDHYLSLQGRPERGSLDAWTTLAGLAHATERIRLGTLVSPVTFRHPSLLAKAVLTVDQISGGRAELGIGAGWNPGEHAAYGFPFPPTGERMSMLAEQIELVHRTWSDGPFDFRGRHYTIEGLDALPKTVARPHPNLIMGGLAGPKSVALAARWADEYNSVFVTPAQAAERRRRVDEAFEREGRDGGLVFSVMTGCVVGEDRGAMRRRVRALMDHIGQTGSEEEWIASAGDQWVIGTVDEAVERIRAYEEAGVSRIMLQHLAHDDVEMVRLIGAEILPKVS